MGSSQPPKGSGPFGYNFSGGANLRPPSPGDDILDPTDSVFLGSFFTNLESNEYTPSYEGLNFSDEWYGPSVPSVVGHATSLGSQVPLDLAPAPSTGILAADYQGVCSFGENMVPIPPPLLPPPPRPQLQPQPVPQSRPQQTQAALPQFTQPFSQPFQAQGTYNMPMEQNAHNDAAALLTTLYTGHQQLEYPPPNTSDLIPGSLLPPSHPPPVRDHRKPVSQSLASHGNARQPVGTDPVDMTFANMFFGTPGSPSSGQRPGEPTPLAWGSDQLFQARQHYEPPLEHESSLALEEKRVFATTHAVIPNSSSSSPPGIKDTPTNSARKPRSDQAKKGDSAATATAMPASKRRKGKVKTEGAEDGEDVAPTLPRATARKRKSKGELKGPAETTLAVEEQFGKRRRPTNMKYKQNLTDAQKRENHIKSEQKRRGAIKEGFDDLNFIVPTLQAGGFSKSATLNMTGDWLEALVQVNEMLTNSLS